MVLHLPRIFRRTRKLLILGVFVTALYLMFQLVSIKLINRHSRDAQRTPQVTVKLKTTLSNEKPYRMNISEGHIPRMDISGVMKTLPHGVPQLYSSKYIPHSNNMFTCGINGMKIPFSLVNDDYCDCDDSSDEPGTSACPQSRFYCRFQVDSHALVWYPGSRVNDGICDCCDGSDEWAGHRVPQFMLHSGNRNVKPRADIFYPCSDQCGALREKTKEDGRIRNMGSRLKRAYIQAGREHGKDGEHGPGGVFYKLSEECFTLEQSGYAYKVCPFVSVEQTKLGHGGEKFDLGNAPSWVSDKMAAGVYELKMTGGSSTHCGAAFRSSLIMFVCGLQDQVVGVSEGNPCTYSFHFTSPAAC